MAIIATFLFQTRHRIELAACFIPVLDFLPLPAFMTKPLERFLYLFEVETSRRELYFGKEKMV